MNDQRHYHTESERRQLDGVVHDAEANGWEISKLNRMKVRANTLPDDSLIIDDDVALQLENLSIQRVKFTKILKTLL